MEPLTETEALAAELAIVRQELATAAERERLASAAYNRQQGSYRELELLYHAAHEQWQAAAQALAFYADPRTYAPRAGDGHRPIDMDAGDLARRALGLGES